jgi:CRISPR-associated protein Cas10/Csm1 subtype III-A
MSQLGTYFYMGNVHKLSQVVANDAYLLIINNEPEPLDCKLPVYRDYIAGNGTRANSFEDLFVNEDSSHKQLAVLRMDVDNLGSLLRSMMAQPNALEAYSIFSHKLDAFFKGRINEMWNVKYSDSTVIIYAGGDDLFIV